MLTIHLAQAVHDLLAGPPPTPTGSAPAVPPTPKVGFNFDGIKNALKFQVAPILVMILGIVFLSRSARGEWSRTLTSGGIALIGVMFIAGAATFLFAGDWLVSLFVK
jgi:hypothetical protein